MLTAPEDLTVDHVASHLREHWALEAVAVHYLPAGHGSHNFVARGTDGRSWFVKANRAGPGSMFFQATYETTAQLHQRGLEFVSAPVRSRSGEVLPRVSDAWDLGLFHHIDGRNPHLDHPAERAQIAQILGRLHEFTPLPVDALRWDPTWLQPELRQILIDGLTQRWAGGRYGQMARDLLATNRSGVERLLDQSERLVARTADDDEPYVVTHGEPHAGNTMLDRSGAMHLIDCDAVIVAPRERDLRVLLHASHRRPRGLDNTDVLAAYRSTAGPVVPRDHVLEAFRAEWHLIEIARYAQQFLGPHGDSADVRDSWQALNRYVPVEQNWTEALLR